MELSGGNPASISICLRMFSSRAWITYASISDNEAIFKVDSWHDQRWSLIRKKKKGLAKPNAML